jgi:hypothetical protein
VSINGKRSNRDQLISECNAMLNLNYKSLKKSREAYNANSSLIDITMILKEKSCKESFEDLQADHFKIWRPF